jgi:hypothetical protein
MDMARPVHAARRVARNFVAGAPTVEATPVIAQGVTAAAHMSWQRRRHAENSRMIRKIEPLDPPLLIVAPASLDSPHNSTI